MYGNKLTVTVLIFLILTTCSCKHTNTINSYRTGSYTPVEAEKIFNEIVGFSAIIGVSFKGDGKIKENMSYPAWVVNLDLNIKEVYNIMDRIKLLMVNYKIGTLVIINEQGLVYYIVKHALNKSEIIVIDGQTDQVKAVI